MPVAACSETYEVPTIAFLPAQWDLIAGLSVGAMMVPSGLSYAAIAGLPAVMGLYGAFVPCIVYAIFGNSKQLSVGPVAVTSLLIGNGMAEVLPGEFEVMLVCLPPRSCADVYLVEKAWQCLHAW